MTATLDPNARLDSLNNRLATLREERAQAQREIAPAGFGDDADRATNVDGHIRLAMLEDRIAAIELQLAEGLPMPNRAPDGTVAVGDVVTVDFGDGPESFLVADTEQGGVGLDVITPDSPLGRALIGVSVGASVEYTAARRRQLRVTLVSVER